MPQRRIHKRLLALPRRVKRWLMVGTDLAALPLALWSAFILRFGEPLPYQMGRFWWLFLLTPLATVPVLHLLGLYRAVVRYMSTQAAFAVVKGVSVSALLLVTFSLMGDFRELPRSVVVLYWVLGLLYVGGSRFLVRTWLQRVARRRTSKEPVVIYGAGAAGLQSCVALLSGNEYEPIAFLDDDAGLHGSDVNGIRVHPPEALAALVERFGVRDALLAMPSVSRGRRREIIQWLERFPVHVKTLPGLADLVSGQSRVDDFRDVEIEDLLGRDPVPADADLLARDIRGKTVMVTGAGGSIGSELCRQIVRQEPAQLLLYEVCEFSLYRIERELRSMLAHGQGSAHLVPLLGSVANGRRLQRVMELFGVDTVYHAAAYKHVPLVEQNLIEGVRNNTFGTLHCAEAAIRAGVASFVLVSTDKAVRPTNVMGASKRLAEMVLQALAQEQARTRFTMVRFGNVLDSSGSVVPLFREQIRRGGPVTVTDEAVTRYFMTIPEAAELVLQAGSMGSGGDVFVLDMGEPVRILDLAQRMIRLSGFELRDERNPDGDIEIRITGLRPGEKLYEELLIGEHVEPTAHRMIMRSEEERVPWNTLSAYLDRMDEACRSFDCAAIRRMLAEIVTGYEAQHGLVDVLWAQENGVSRKAITDERKLLH